MKLKTDKILDYISDALTWNTNGTTSVDLFLKKGAIKGARQLLDTANVTYNIIIHDVQNQIENENPPKEIIEQLQNRKGK